MSKPKPKKRLGLSTEPQPVFVGACFALIMLFLRFYVIQLTLSGELVCIFNTPVALINLVLSGETINPVVWFTQLAAPVLMIAFAAVIGKKHAGFLVIPSLIPAVYSVIMLVSAQSMTGYYIVCGLYILSAIVYILASILIKKTALPFIAYCILICAGVVIATIAQLPPFTLFDGSIYVSALLEFIAYHIAIANFARAIPMQTKAQVTEYTL